MAKLIRLSESREEYDLEVPLEEKGYCSIGRVKPIGIQLEDKGVSRTHAAIFRKDSDYFILDLGSKNGTFYLDQDQQWQKYNSIQEVKQYIPSGFYGILEENLIGRFLFSLNLDRTSNIPFIDEFIKKADEYLGRLADGDTIGIRSKDDKEKEPLVCRYTFRFQK